MSALQLRSSCSPRLPYVSSNRIRVVSRGPQTTDPRAPPHAFNSPRNTRGKPRATPHSAPSPRTPRAALPAGEVESGAPLPAAEPGDRAARKGPGRPFEWWKCVRLTLSISLPPFPPLPPSRVRPPSASVPRPVCLPNPSATLTSPTKKDRLRGCPASSSSPPRR